ncbi:MAG: YitT family protein [Negativicutes bacterium]|jgi:uncharacterized membrane-anchored protein YitT (DUF2179 family)|nr:YitT family protein [Negativicutes bacterium]MBP9537812.1 YitT family protein [Negativicutes bacterium]MBP9949849.1 YitT family protein [Negativicutes bacterium]
MKKNAGRYLLITLGCLISTCSINLFLVPHQLLSGGISGIAIIFYYLVGLPIGVQILAMNLPLLYLAYKMFGKKYALDILFGIVIFSLLVDITSFLNHFNAVDDVMLAAIYGGVFTGIGYGIVFRSNSSTGGMDIVAAIVKTKYGFSVGFINFAVNCGLMVVASLLFGLKLAMFTLISMFISSNLTDKVVAGLNNKKTVVIISGKSEEIAEEIIKEVGRGVTYLKGQGAFTLQDKDIIFVVVNLTQIAKIKLIVDGIDKYAFMIVQDANEVLGRGFTLPSSKKKK